MSIQHNKPVVSPAIRNRTKQLACGLCLSVPLLALAGSVYANYDRITVNKEPVDKTLFEAFEKHGLPDKDFCAPNTHTYVIEQVVSRVLLRNAGRESNLDNSRSADARAAERDMRELLEALPDGSSDDEKARMALWLLVAESDEYGRLLSDVNYAAPRDQYLTLLENNSPLVVSVPLVRLATIEFDTLNDAETTHKELDSGKEFRQVATSLGFGSSYYNNKSAQWHHISSLQHASKGKSVEAGQIVGPLFDAGKWRVYRIEETKTLPVVLMDDSFGESNTSIMDIINTHTANANQFSVLQSLWKNADVRSKRKKMPMSDSIDHCRNPM